MDDRVARLKTPEECEQFIINVKERLPELAKEARRKAIKLRADKYGAQNEAEHEALQAVYAYEEVQSKRRGKKFRASRTWPMIERHGIIEAVERAVNRPTDPVGYQELVAMGMQEISFEAVVLRHPNVFSQEAVQRCEDRLKTFQS